MKWWTMRSSPNLLDIRKLGKVFAANGSHKSVLKNVDFRLGMKESLAVVGPSGCGKSTLMLIVAGLIPASEGRVELDGETLTGPDHRIALVLQEYGLFPWKTTEMNITLGARMRKIDVPEKAVERLKKELGIEGLDRLYPHQISGGPAPAGRPRPRAFARSQAAHPGRAVRGRGHDHSASASRATSSTCFTLEDFSFILVTHNIEEAVYLGQRIAVMDDGVPAKIDIIDNPGFGNVDFRESPEFFRRTSRLRRMLGKSSRS